MTDIDRIHEARESIESATEAMKKGLNQRHETLKAYAGAKQEEAEKKAQEAIESVQARTQEDMDYRKQIGAPTINLFGKLSVWGNLPEPLRGQISEQVSGLVQQAREGDSVSQQILTGVKGRLLKAKTDLGSVPSLDWETKEQPSKP